MSGRPEYRDPREQGPALTGIPPEPTSRLLPCSGCHAVAELDELLEVVEIRTGRSFHVHRPTGQRPCFRWKVMSAAQHRVVPASKRND